MPHAGAIGLGGFVIEKLSLVLGGARSGKSSYAEELAERSGRSPIYLATAECFDDEMKARVDAHKARRPDHWQTVEEPLEILDALGRVSSDDSIVVVDCLTLWLSNLFRSDREADEEIVRLLDGLGELPGPVILVSNEVGMGIVPENALSRAFRDVQGAVNQKIAAQAELVIFMAAGLPMILKGPELL